MGDDQGPFERIRLRFMWTQSAAACRDFKARAGKRDVNSEMNLYDFGNLPDDVRETLWRTGRESFFNLPEWYRLVAEHGSAEGTRTGLAVGRGVGIGLAFSRSRRDRILRSCTNLYTCEYSILGDCLTTQSIVNFIDEYVTFVESLDGLRFEGFHPEDPSFSVVMEGIRLAGFVAKPYRGWVNWFEPTSGTSFQDYVSTRPSLLQNTWRRKSSALQKATDSIFRICRAIEDVEPLIATYENLREQSWKSAEPYPEFIPGLIRVAARLGALRFGVLSIDGVPAAAQFWIVWDGRATIYKLVHAEKFADYSPGTLLTMEMMRNVLEDDRPSEIDFGRGDDAYKKLWLRSRRERWGIEAANPRTWRGFRLSLRIGLALARNRMRG